MIMKAKKKVGGVLFVAALLFLPLPGRAHVGIVSGLTQEKVCKPGETFQGSITIRNYGPASEDVRVYQTDYAFTYDGKGFYDPPGQAARSNAAWITTGQKQLTVPGSSQVELRYAVKVPDDTNLVGTYWSVIMVETPPKAGAVPAAAPAKEPSLGIDQVIRYAVQIVTHIGNTGSRKLEFVGTELLQDAGQKTFQVDVENTGERWLRTYSHLELYSLKGELAGKFEGERLRTFPGTSVRFKFDVSHITDGRYKALVVLDNKDSHVFGAQYTLDFTKSGKETGSL
jgi:urease beta subunit